jgi:hypothetical protein
VVDVRRRVTPPACALVPVGSGLRHVDLRLHPEDLPRPPPGGGRGKGEAGAAGPTRASTRRTLAAAIASAVRCLSSSPSCSSKLREQEFIRRVALPARFVGTTCMLLAVRNAERRGRVTEPERRRARLPDRPAARMRTDATWCDRHTLCWAVRGSNAFHCRGDVRAAQGQQRHGVRKPRDRLAAQCTRRMPRATGADR